MQTRHLKSPLQRYNLSSKLPNFWNVKNFYVTVFLVSLRGTGRLDRRQRSETDPSWTIAGYAAMQQQL